MRRHRFYAAVHSIETGEEENLATFYLMNTTVNLNGWGVSDKALEEALPTILRKPLGCGPGYRIDDHYPDAVDVGRFVRSDKPNGYALGTAEITDGKVWGNLVSGEWGPISVVILSYRETCSKCGEDLTQTENPFSHGCIAEGKAYVLVESFVFERADFIDIPAVPQAGFINVAAHEQVPLEQLARFYEAQSHQAPDNPRNGDSTHNEAPPKHHESQSNKDPAQGPGAHPGSNPEEEERKKQLENELQQRVTELEQQLVDERKARESVESQLTEIQAREHAELVEETLTARVEAGLVEDMVRGGRRNLTGVNFTDVSKEAMATALKEKMRNAVCPGCGWVGYVDAAGDQWRTMCPEGCVNEDGGRVSLRPLLHLPYDMDLFAELNVERYELSKSGKLLFNHPQGANDDRFWALALAVYASEMVSPPVSKPIGKII